MVQYIDKSTIVAEIERRMKKYATIDVGNSSELDALYGAKCKALMEILSFINTLEVKDVDNWHLQEKEDIYDAVKDWGLYTFACIMKDGTIQKFTGNLDEDCEGHINIHIDGTNDDYDDVDDIVKWIELT